jgi:hypothetical protein
MNRNVAFGLLCLVIFLAAYVGGSLVIVQGAFTQAPRAVTNRTGFNTITITPCGGGDSGGGGRPGSINGSQNYKV